MMLRTIGLVAAAAAAALLYVDVSSDNFRQKVKREIQQIRRGDAGVRAQVFRYKDLKGLPEPVQRYFKYAMKDGQEYIRSVTLKQDGVFRTKQANRWIPFEAEQHYATGSPAFVWYACLKPSPYVWIDARDMYYGGSGTMVGKLLSAVPLSSAVGRETDISSLGRFLAESPWFPTALLPGEHIDWKYIDADTAKVVIRDHGYSVSAVFTFNEKGEITQVTTDERYRNMDGRFRKERWTGYFRNYRDMNDVKIPTEVEAEWNLSQGNFSYARMKVMEIRYNDS